MPYEHKEGQGSLFRNEKQNDRQPDFKGTILIGGKTYEIAAWSRRAQSGKEYLSLQASLPRQNDGTAPQQGGYQARRPAAAPMPVVPPPTEEDLPLDDGDMPF